MQRHLRKLAFALFLPMVAAAAESVEPSDGKLSLEVGVQKVWRKEGLARLAVADPAVVDVKVLEKERIQLTGLKAGRTTLLVWRETGEREAVMLSVNEYPQSERLESLGLSGPDPEDPLELKVGVERLVPLKGFTNAAVNDTGICELKVLADGAVVLRGRRAGETTLEVSGGGMEVVYDVVVTDERAPVPAEQPLRVEVGLQRVVTLPGIERVAIGDPKVCDVKTPGAGQLLLVGLSPGRTTLLVWQSGGQRRRYEVVVSAPRLVPTSPAVAEDETHVELRLAPGHTKALAIPGVERVALGDPSIATVELAGRDRLRVSGLKAGATSLLSWNASGQNTPITVIVAAEPRAPAPPLTDVTPDFSETLTLAIGESATRELTGLARVITGDPAVAAVSVAGPRLTVSGRAPGEAMLLVWGPGAARFAYRVVVRAR